MNYAVEVSNLTKIYKIFASDTKRALNALGFPVPHKEFRALDDLSYRFEEGEVTAILGRNGSGKSTLLKLITGVSTPTSGTIKTTGRISAMLELKSGFDGELTGMENIYYKGLTMGMSHEEIDAIKDAIIDFADIGIHIDQPFRTYSSGMKARLGFAVAAHIDPEILIVDEALSVGDDIFKMKCVAKMTEFRQQGKTILFVSHSLSTVKAFCTRAIWINKGVLMAQGAMGDVVAQYEEYLKEQRAEMRLRALEEQEEDDLVLSKRDVMSVRRARLLDADGVRVKSIGFRDPLTVQFEYEIKKPVQNLTVAFVITNSEGIEVFSCDKQSHHLDQSIGAHVAQIVFPSVELIPGGYYITGELWDTQSSLSVRFAKAQRIMVEQRDYVGGGITYMDHEVVNAPDPEPEDDSQ